MKEKSRRLKKDLFIVDTGDTHDGNNIFYMCKRIATLIGFLGNGLSDTTNPHGAVTQPMLLHIPYDILAIGKSKLLLILIRNCYSL